VTNVPSGTTSMIDAEFCLSAGSKGASSCKSPSTCGEPDGWTIADP
jgi:hypothetical protein